MKPILKLIKIRFDTQWCARRDDWTQNQNLIIQWKSLIYVLWIHALRNRPYFHNFGH